MKILKFKEHIFRTKLYVTFITLLLLFSNIVLGQCPDGTLLNVEDLSISIDQTPVQKIKFGNLIGNIYTKGLCIESEPLSQKGGQFGIHADVSSTYSSQSGRAFARLASCQSWSSNGHFIGVSGRASSTAINNSSFYSTILGGHFKTLVDTDVELNGNTFWVGGIKAELNGIIDNTSLNGAVAAVIGIDANTGTAQSWGGYFEGKGYYSDKVIIGTKDIPSLADNMDVSNFNLFVTGGILTEDVVIKSTTLWADYVFKKDYRLLSLNEVEKYINKNGHLPNTPSSTEVEKNGFKVSEITTIQQEKIEELFLHAIVMDKENQKLKSENEDLKERLENIEKRLLNLESK